MYISGNTLLQLRYLIKFYKYRVRVRDEYKNNCIFASSHTYYSRLDITICPEINKMDFLSNKDKFIEFCRDGIGSFTSS